MIQSLGVRYILLSSLFFSIMNISVKFLKHIPPHELIFFRSVISLSLCYYSLKKMNVSPWGNNKPVLILRGLFGTLALLMYFYTIQNIPLATAITLQYLSPLFTIILAVFILKEKTKPIQWLFFMVSFAGVMVIKGFDTSLDIWMVVIGVLAALFSGLAYNMVRKLKDYDHPLVVIFYFPLMSIPTIGFYTATHFVVPTMYDWIGIVVLGVFTQLGQLYMTKAYQTEEFSKISNFNYLGIVYAMLYGFFIFDETVSFYGIIGILMILSGVVLSGKFKQ